MFIIFTMLKIFLAIFVKCIPIYSTPIYSCRFITFNLSFIKAYFPSLIKCRSFYFMYLFISIIILSFCIFASYLFPCPLVRIAFAIFFNHILSYIIIIIIGKICFLSIPAITPVLLVRIKTIFSIAAKV